MVMHATVTSSTLPIWNGPVCSTCGTRYLGQHACSPAEITRRISELLELLTLSTRASQSDDRTRGCPCRPENGGSGICGCILGGPAIT